MERELMLTGIGGQGVQLAAQTLARGLTLEGRFVQSLGTYGGTMRGGNTDSTLVFGDAPLTAPPIVSKVGAAIALHHRFFEPTRAKLRPDAILVINSTLFDGDTTLPAAQVFEVPATEIATTLGNAIGASMVAVAAWARITDAVGIESLVQAMTDALPPYRRQHAERNAELLRAGFDVVESARAPIWVEASS
jgi:Pyruvate/2-oxoacid:ferredoxin oxidoreductase gamma subunit